MILGFTGTRAGMTQDQKDAFRGFVTRLQPTEFHHGDCQGADDQAANIVYEVMGIRCVITAHPGPAGDPCRAYNKHTNICLPPESHLKRNRIIVDTSEQMIACPKEGVHQQRGGTWYTYDYAVRRRKRVSLIPPKL